MTVLDNGLIGLGSVPCRTLTRRGTYPRCSREMRQPAYSRMAGSARIDSSILHSRGMDIVEISLAANFCTTYFFYVVQKNTRMLSLAPSQQTRRARKRQQTADRLVEVAIDLFAQHGCPSVTMEQNPAAMTKSTLYNHFPVKGALVRQRMLADQLQFMYLGTRLRWLARPGLELADALEGMLDLSLNGCALGGAS